MSWLATWQDRKLVTRHLPTVTSSYSSRGSCSIAAMRAPEALKHLHLVIRLRHEAAGSKAGGQPRRRDNPLATEDPQQVLQRPPATVNGRNQMRIAAL